MYVQSEHTTVTLAFLRKQDWNICQKKCVCIWQACYIYFLLILYSVGILITIKHNLGYVKFFCTCCFKLKYGLYFKFVLFISPPAKAEHSKITVVIFLIEWRSIILHQESHEDVSTLWENIVKEMRKRKTCLFHLIHSQKSYSKGKVSYWAKMLIGSENWLS